MTTTGPRIGGLFEGYGGLTMGVQAVLGGTVVWHSEIDPDASRTLAHHWPDVPNLGDITKIKWTPDCPTCGEPLALYWLAEDAHRAYWCRTHGEFDLSLWRTQPGVAEPVDIITGGSPCQDVSSAGKRQGMRAGTRSGLWDSMVDAIDVLRPRLVVWENVRGVLSAEADSAMEPCPGCVGNRDDGPVLRALGRVLGDLCELGYDAQWCGLPAASIDAPHGRYREFVAAHPAGQPWSVAYGDDVLARRAAVRRGPAARSGATADASHVGHERSRSARDGRPGSADGGRASTADTSGDGRDEGRPESARLIGRSDAALGGDAVADAFDSAPAAPRSRDVGSGEAVRAAGSWGQYEPAIRRWERALGRVAPAPTELGAKGGQRLSPRFVEWMMGLPEGHVTDPAIGISRNAQLKALGNGVVPQQAAAAVSFLLTASERAA